jgi:hypothetical protein
MTDSLKLVRMALADDADDTGRDRAERLAAKNDWTDVGDPGFPERTKSAERSARIDEDVVPNLRES